MKSRRYLAIPTAALALFFAVPSARTQPAEQTPAQNWGAPEIVEVQAAPGPAVWHLTRGDSEVWILGTVGAMPDSGVTGSLKPLYDVLPFVDTPSRKELMNGGSAGTLLLAIFGKGQG